jgi:hypothetical protein
VSTTQVALVVGTSAFASLLGIAIARSSVSVRSDTRRWVLSIAGLVLVAGGITIASDLLKKFVLRITQPSTTSTDAIAVLGLILTVIAVYSIYLLSRFETDRKDLEERLSALESTAAQLRAANSDYLDSAKYNAAKLTAYIGLAVAIDEKAGQDDPIANQDWTDLTLVQCLTARSTGRDVAFDLDGLVSIETAEPGRISAIIARPEVSPFFELAYGGGLLRSQLGIPAGQWQKITQFWATFKVD